jgi:hypothetical protein
MNKLLIVFSLLFVCNIALADKIYKTKRKSVYIKVDDPEVYNKGDYLDIIDGNGKKRGVVKVLLIKKNKIGAKIIKGKAKKGWTVDFVDEMPAEEVAKKEAEKKKDITYYVSAGGGMYTSTDAEYTETRAFIAEFGQQKKKFLMAGTFIYSGEAKNDFEFGTFAGTFDLTQTTIHGLGSFGYLFSEFAYVKLTGGYIHSSATLKSNLNGESVDITATGSLFGFGLGGRIPIPIGFINIEYASYSYTISEGTVDGQEVEDASGSEARTLLTASVAYTF